MSILSVHPELLAMSSTVTPEECRGVLAHIFDALPLSARAANYQERLVAEGFDNPSAISLLDREALTAMGFKVAHVLLVLAAISGTLPTPGSLSAPFVAGTEEESSAKPADAAAAAPTKLGAANEFPELRTSGLPGRGALEAWLIGFAAHVGAAVGEEAERAIGLIASDPSGDLGAEWRARSEVNGKVWRAWLNAGSKGLPHSLVLSIPAEIRADCLGLP
jgi:hypothetical protein